VVVDVGRVVVDEMLGTVLKREESGKIKK